MSQKIQYPASERNKRPILEVLKKHFSSEEPGNVLEISSGTGQHASYFAEHFPKLTFQPSEYEKSLFNSIKAYARDTPTKNVKDPIEIDVSIPCELWNLEHKSYDYVININMIHISPNSCTEGLFKNTPRILKPGGLLVTYGPYAHNGVITPQSNIDFDKGLRMQNREWGLRDIKDLETLAKSNGIQLLHIYNLPANNKCLIWKHGTT